MYPNIDAERVQNGMTVEQLTEKIGVTRKTSAELAKMSYLFGVSADYLLAHNNAGRTEGKMKMPRLKTRVDKRDSRLYGVIAEYSYQLHVKRPQLAKACGVSETTLSKKINNPGCFTLHEIRAICEFLKIPTDERNFI